MSEDDPRHGTNAGYVAGCKSGCCRTAHADYKRSLRAKRYLRRVERLHVPALGTHRRIHALQALGWRLGDIDCALGKGFRTSHTHNLLCQDAVHLDTAIAVAAVYERLSMTPGPSETTRKRAKRWGYAPPLAWDCIDDPDEQPRGWEYAGQPRQSRLEILTELDQRHEGITTACSLLKVKREAIERWAERHDERALYERMVARETPRYWANQHAERSA